MNLSEHIKFLKSIKKRHGDILVVEKTMEGYETRSPFGGVDDLCASGNAVFAYSGRQSTQEVYVVNGTVMIPAVWPPQPKKWKSTK